MENLVCDTVDNMWVYFMLVSFVMDYDHFCEVYHVLATTNESQHARDGKLSCWQSLLQTLSVVCTINFVPSNWKIVKCKMYAFIRSKFH